MRMMIARYFRAAKSAIKNLQNYYETDIHTLDKEAVPYFPYQYSYRSLSNNTIEQFTYQPTTIKSSQQPFLQAGKLVFRGLCNGQDIIIKFVRQYSKDAHQYCAEQGFAPKLRAYSKLHGGWFMVVMDYVGDTHEEVSDMDSPSASAKKKITARTQEIVKSLHDAGFVHGDIRDTNVMVQKEGDPAERILLIDFDWAGKIGEVKYPMNVNRAGIRRHMEVFDGISIDPKHDDYSAEFIMVKRPA